MRNSLAKHIDQRLSSKRVRQIEIRQPGRAGSMFINQGEFVAMKTLSGCKTPHCDKHQFCDKMTVSTRTVFEISSLNFVVLFSKQMPYNFTTNMLKAYLST